MLLRRFPMLIAVLALAAALLLPAYAVAQGRGHGRGLSKKSEKLVTYSENFLGFGSRDSLIS